MQPKRIASLLASGTEILYALGLGDRVVAVSHECDYPEDARQKPRVTFTRVAIGASSKEIDEQVRSTLTSGSPLYEVDYGVLEKLRPDLIVTQAQCDVCAVRYDDVVDAVENSAVLNRSRIVDLNPNRLEDVFRDILRVADMAEVLDRAKAYVTNLRTRVEAVRHRTSRLPASAQPRVVCLEWCNPLMVAANWTPELVKIAGGQHELTTTGVHSTYTAWEKVLEYQPQVIIVAPCGFDLSRALVDLELLKQLPSWAKTPAAQTRRVFACDGNAYFNRSGPRLVDSLEILAHLIQPGLFGPPACCPEPYEVWQQVD